MLKLSLAAVALAFAPAIFAQVEPSANAQDPDSAPAAAEEVSDEPELIETEWGLFTEEQVTEMEDFDSAIEGLERIDGTFPLYKRDGDLLLELSEDNLGKLWHMQAALHTGLSALGAQAGDPVGSTAVDVMTFELHDDSVWLVRPNLRFRWEDHDPLAVASERSFPNAILASYDVEERHPGRRLLLVNITDFFYGSLVQLEAVVGLVGGGSLYLDYEKSRLESAREVDGHTIVRMALHFQGDGSGGGMADIFEMLGLSFGDHLEDGRSAPLDVTFNLWYRDESSYVPRFADGRVGYFTQDFYSIDRFYERDRTERFIMRYHLEKKDPEAELSEPVEPIVWYVDNSVPEQYRESVRQGILAWNIAFEEAGFKDAIVVKDAPEDDPDWDHADGMHNLVRWTMSEDAAYGVALFRTDPFTGEVLNASVTVDANYPAFEQQLLEHRIEPTVGSRMRETALAAISGKPLDAGCLEHALCGHDHDPAREKLGAALEGLGWRMSTCTRAEEVGREAAMALMTLRASGAQIDEKAYMDQFVKELVLHEVGHCLGLRHNFAGSTFHTSEELLDDDLMASLGVSASVMDYNAPNMSAALRGSGIFYCVVPGVYDRWAIRYGYTPFGASRPTDERRDLAAIARESGQPGHLFLTDEDADGVNPLAVRWDQAQDTLTFLDMQLRSNEAIQRYAVNSAVRRGEDYGFRTNLILNSILGSGSAAYDATRFIGGVEFRRQFRGDDNEMPTLAPVDPAVQHAALEFVISEVLSVDSVDVPRDVLYGMSQDVNSGAGAFWNAPIRDLLASNLIGAFAELMSYAKLSEIRENEFKMAGLSNRYTLVHHFEAILGAVYEEVWQGGLEVNPVRRDLQRFAADGLMLIASDASAGDSRVLAAHWVRELSTGLATAAETPGIDPMTQLHFRDLAEQLERFLDREAIGM